MLPPRQDCGDALSGKTVAILHELGLFEEVCDLPGAAVARIVFGSPDETAASIDLSRYELHNALTGRVLPMEGFVIRREVFDDFLFAKARAAAAQTLEGFAVRELLREDEQVCGVGGVQPMARAWNSRALGVGCDGFNSIVARKSGLYRHESRDWMVALRQYFEGVAGLSDQIELHFIDEVRPGYFGFSLEGDRANVGIGMDHRDIKARGIDLKDVLAAAVASKTFGARFRDAAPSKTRSAGICRLARGGDRRTGMAFCSWATRPA